MSMKSEWNQLEKTLIFRIRKSEGKEPLHMFLFFRGGGVQAFETGLLKAHFLFQLFYVKGVQ